MKKKNASNSGTSNTSENEATFGKEINLNGNLSPIKTEFEEELNTASNPSPIRGPRISPKATITI